MGRQDVTMARSVETAENYHRWVFSSFKKFLKSGGISLEVGAGHCGYTNLISNISRKVIVADINKDAVDKIKNTLSGNKNIETLVMDGIEPSKISTPVDNIVAINLIEHLCDDRSFVQECHSVLANEGRLIVFAPAFPFLFSNIDKQAGHFRRYRKKDIGELLSKCGFKVCYLRYFNVAGFVGWLFNKTVRSGVNSGTTNLQVVIYNKIIWPLKCFEILSGLFGLSIIAVGVKK
jgi:Methyltransferase domain.